MSSSNDSGGYRSSGALESLLLRSIWGIARSRVPTGWTRAGHARVFEELAHLPSIYPGVWQVVMRRPGLVVVCVICNGEVSNATATVDVNRYHPRLGRGLWYTFKPPRPRSQRWDNLMMVEWLNAAERNGEIDAPRLGVWDGPSRGKGVRYCAFLPAVLGMSVPHLPQTLLHSSLARAAAADSASIP